MANHNYIALLLAILPASASADWYVAIDSSYAHFSRATESSEAISRKLASEGVDSDTTSRSSDGGFSPVIGYRLSRRWGVEIGMRKFSWASNVQASQENATLISSDTGEETHVQNLEFRSKANTNIDALTLGVTYRHRVNKNSVFTKLSLVIGNVCSDVYEESTADGRDPWRVQSTAGTCRYSTTYSTAIGYTRHFRSMSVTAYGEAIYGVGNNGVVFVDGGGVSNTTVPVLGLRFEYRL